MASELGEKRPGDEPFESETEVPDAAGDKLIVGAERRTLWGIYCEDDLHGMVVRGWNFMEDKKKVDCGPPMYKLMHADIFKTRTDQERQSHFAARPDSWAYRRWERLQAARESGAPLSYTAAMAADPLAPLIVINFLIPGSGFNMNLVCFFARRIKTAEQLRAIRAAKGHKKGAGAASAKSPSHDAADYTQAQWESDDFPHDLDRVAAFDNLLNKFVNADDEWRDGRLKIIPRVAEGNWIVKKSIGRVPAILGKKVKQFYYRDEEKNYIEIDADLGTSVVAGRIIQMVKGTCKNLVVDLSFLVQGEDKTELPESLIGGIRMIHVDLDKQTWLEDNMIKNPVIFDC